MKEEEFANSICYLPLDQIDRVQLWLTNKQVKPASTILLPNSEKDLEGKKLSKVMRWVKRASLRYSKDLQNPRLLHVSKDKKKVDVLRELQWSQKEEDIVKRGVLYGYPKEAVESFARGWVMKTLDKEMASKEEIKEAVKDESWKNYLVYGVRKGHVIEDSRVAREWADNIQKDIPKLARWYENS